MELVQTSIFPTRKVQKWYFVSDPKRIFLKEIPHENQDTKKYEVRLEDKIIGYYHNEWFGCEPTFIYINDTTFLILFDDTPNRTVDEEFSYCNFEIWKNGNVIFSTDKKEIIFVNENEICFSSFKNFQGVTDILDFYANHYDLENEKITTFQNHYWSRGPFLRQIASFLIFIPKKILDFEIKKFFERGIDNYDLFKTWTKQKSEDDDVIIHLTEKQIIVKQSKIRKYNSVLLNSQMENGEIFLPITHFDSSFECLDYLAAKYLDIKLLKTFVKKLY